MMGTDLGEQVEREAKNEVGVVLGLLLLARQCPTTVPRRAGTTSLLLHGFGCFTRRKLSER